MKRLTALFLAVLVLSAMLVLPAEAIDPFDTTQPLALNILFMVDEQYQSGVRFTLYRVGDMSGYGELTLSDAFKGCGAASLTDLTTEQTQQLCEACYAYLLAYPGIACADTGLTDINGKLAFPTGNRTLLPGLYLAVSERFLTDGVSHEAAPFLVCLPYRGEDEVWNYTMTVSPKAADTRVDVQILWEDQGYQDFRPKSVRVELLRGDGTVYDIVVLDEESGWHYTWEDLPAGIRWSVREVLPGNVYKVYTERVPGGFRITNTYTPVPGKTLPQTGLLRWPVPVLTCLGVLLFVLGWRKQRKCADEKK